MLLKYWNVRIVFVLHAVRCAVFYIGIEYVYGSFAFCYTHTFGKNLFSAKIFLLLLCYQFKLFFLFRGKRVKKKRRKQRKTLKIQYGKLNFSFMFTLRRRHSFFLRFGTVHHIVVVIFSFLFLMLFFFSRCRLSIGFMSENLLTHVIRLCNTHSLSLSKHNR